MYICVLGRIDALNKWYTKAQENSLSCVAGADAKRKFYNYSHLSKRNGKRRPTEYGIYKYIHIY